MRETCMDTKRLIEILKSLISIDTVSHKSNSICTQFIADHLDACGFKVECHSYESNNTVKSSIIAYIGPQNENGLIFSGHMDTVPWETQPGWYTNPINLTEKNGDLIGRGVSDMKGFISQCLFLAQKIKADKLKKPLFYIFTCDEEIGCIGSKKLLSHMTRIQANNFLPKIAIIGEPTNLKIYTASKGYAEIKLVIKGQGAHSSRPDTGINAIEIASNIIQRVCRLNNKLKALPISMEMLKFSDFPYSHINCGLISGGTAPNFVPEQSTLHLSVRLMPEADVKFIVDCIQDTISKEAKKLKSFNDSESTKIELLFNIPPMKSDRNLSIFHQLATHYENPDFHGAPFVSDGSNFNQIGIQSYICGPGLIEQAHQANESIPIANLEKGARLLHKSIFTLY